MKPSLRSPFKPWQLLLTGLLGLYSNLPLFRGQFAGDDEVMQWVTVSQLRAGALDLSLHDFFRAIWRVSIEYHPPLRFFLALPGVVLSPHSEWGLRLGAVFVSFWMTYEIMILGFELGGVSVGFFSGLFTVASGIFSWTSMGFGWSVIVLALVKSSRWLRSASLDLTNVRERGIYRTLQITILLAFLTNTGCLLFCLAAGLIYSWANRIWRDRIRLRHLFRATLPFAAFYALYYVYFFGAIPWIAHRRGVPIDGQVFQSRVRWDTAHLNVSSLLENLRAANTYFLPWAGWLIPLVIGVYLWRNQRRTLFFFSLYSGVWSFYLSGNSSQYFLLSMTALLPFFLNQLREWCGKRLFSPIAAILAISMLAWSSVIFVWNWSELDYPNRWIRRGWGESSARHNVIFPYAEITQDLTRRMRPDEQFETDGIGGAYAGFYFHQKPDAPVQYAGILDEREVSFDPSLQCWAFNSLIEPLKANRTRFLITRRNFCEGEPAPQIEEALHYPGSDIRLLSFRSIRSLRER